MADEQLRGVNLGGWLLLEKWMTPSLFEGLRAIDEYTFSQELGEEKATKKLTVHRNSFITEEDFKWIADRNLNALRIPIGYWIFGDAAPYIGGISWLDWAIDTAAEYKLQVLIDLHGVQGSQNGADHSGQTGEALWHRDEKNKVATVEVIERLAEHYKNHSALWGIQVLNEPHGPSKRFLHQYYREAYAAVRRHCGPEVRVVLHDAFKLNWAKRMRKSEQEWEGVLLDTHLYRCFGRWDKRRRIEWHIRNVCGKWGKLVHKAQEGVLVGEWSVALDHHSLKHLDQAQQQAAIKKYAQAELEVFGRTPAWFFWSYKTEASGVGWSMRGAVEAGVFPKKF